LTFILSSLSIGFISVQGKQPPPPDIFIINEPESQEIKAGSSTTYILKIISQDAFEGFVELKIEDLPNGVEAIFSTNPVEVPAFFVGITILTLETSIETPQGNFNIQISGTALNDSSIEDAKFLFLEITPPSEITKKDVETIIITSTKTLTTSSQLTYPYIETTTQFIGTPDPLITTWATSATILSAILMTILLRKRKI